MSSRKEQPRIETDLNGNRCCTVRPPGKYSSIYVVFDRIFDAYSIGHFCGGKLCRSFIIFWLSTQADDDDPFDSRPGRRSSTDVAPSLAKPNDIIRADVTVSFACCAVLSVTES